MKSRIDSIELPNGWELDSFKPQDEERFELTVRAMIGPDPGEGEESFDFQVCSIEWVSNEIQRKGFHLARRLVVVACWDIGLIHSAIGSVVSSTTGDSWDEISQKLSRIARWEFEDSIDQASRIEEQC